MRRLLFVSATVLIALMMSAAPTRAQTIELAATLSGSTETPAVLTGANATAKVTLNPDQTVAYELVIFNIPSGTTQAHFHVGGVGLAGPIVVDIPVPTTISNDFTVRGTAGPPPSAPSPSRGSAPGRTSCSHWSAGRRISTCTVR